MKNGKWEDITVDDIIEVKSAGSLGKQTKALGFSKSQGSETALAWRKWWLGILDFEEIETYKNTLKKKEPGQKRVTGTVLMLGLLASGRELSCVTCGVGYQPKVLTRITLEVDHIIPWKLTFDNREENLQILCSWHHKLQTTGSAASMYSFRESLNEILF